MNGLSALTLVVLMACVASAVASTDSCNAHVTEKCSEVGTDWTTGSCNSLFGGFKGNSNNLHQLMQSHFQDSFKLLLTATHFSSDEVNRMGIHKTVMGQSDDLWAKGKSIMDYVLKRGGRMGEQFQMNDVQLTGNVKSEVEVLGATLDIVKAQAERTVAAYRHSMNKKVHHDEPTQDSFDPALAHFLEDSLLEPYSATIRDLAGKLNILARIVRNDNTRAMGLHLFDQSLA